MLSPTQAANVVSSAVVSKDTLEKIMVVMKHHLTPSQVRAIIATAAIPELHSKPGAFLGNRSPLSDFDSRW